MLDWPIEKFVPQASEVEQISWIDQAFLKEDLSRYPKRYIAALPGMLHLLAMTRP